MTRILLGCLALAMMVSVHSVYGFDDIADAQKAILDIAKKLEDGKDVKTDVAALRKKIEELEPIMHNYKPKAKKGIHPEGIEAKIQKLAGKGISAETLKKEKDDLVKLAYANLAMGHIAKAYAPTKVKMGKGPKQWNDYSDEMMQGTLELIKEAKAGNAAKIKAIATNINAACEKCHTDFR